MRLARDALRADARGPRAAVDHHQLVEIAAEDAEKLDAFEQGGGAVAGLVEHAALERDHARVMEETGGHLSVLVKFRADGVAEGHLHGLTWRTPSSNRTVTINC